MEYDAAYFGRQIPNYTATRFQEVLTLTFFAMRTQSNFFFLCFADRVSQYIYLSN